MTDTVDTVVKLLDHIYIHSVTIRSYPLDEYYTTTESSSTTVLCIGHGVEDNYIHGLVDTVVFSTSC